MNAKPPFRSLRNLKDLWVAFFRRGKPFWLWLGCLTLSTLVLWWLVQREGYVFFPCKEDELRIIGWILQIGGFITVAVNLSATAHGVGVPSIAKWIRNYFASVPSLRKQVHNLHGVNITVPSASVVAEGQVGRVGSASTEERIAALEAEVVNQREQVRALLSDLKSIGNELGTKITAEKEERVRQISETRNLIGRLLVDGIHKEWAGIVLFLIGVTLGTVSPEIVTLFFGTTACADA